MATVSESEKLSSKISNSFYGESEIGKSTKPKAKKDLAPGRSIDTYAAQCEKCQKWRVIDSQEEYEDIRSNMPENLFYCSKKQGGVSCEDPADIYCDSTRTWVMDKPGEPKTPKGFKRSLVLRKDYSKMDTYYITPTGEKLRSRKEIASYFDANPEVENAPLCDFSFSVPKVMEVENAPLCDFSFSVPKVMEDTLPPDAKLASPIVTTTTEKSSTKQIQD